MKLKRDYLVVSDLSNITITILFAAIFLLIPENVVQAQEGGQFNQYKGIIVDAKTKKSLEFATITVTNTNISTISNIDGIFSLKVPLNKSQENVLVSYLGYKNTIIPLKDFTNDEMMVKMEESFEKLPDVNIVDADPVKVIKRVIDRRRSNLYKDPLLVKAFYRESIKKRRAYASLSEAVVDIYKQPLMDQSRDYVKLDRARKSTDYKKIDTLVIKLQGGPYNNLGMDMMRNEELFFSEDMFEIYSFSFDKMINMDDKNVYVIDFVQRGYIVEPFYRGKLYVDSVSFALVKAVFSLNIENLNKAKRFFVKKKPPKADVVPIDTKYTIDYRMTDGKWHYSYGRIELSFKVKWDKKWFNSLYHITIEMAITDWEPNLDKLSVRNKERMRRDVILTDQASGFSDPSFWGEHNVIEPDKSIHNAIKKIQRNYQKEN